MATQLVVYIHGVIPAHVAGPHRANYDELRQGITQAMPAPKLREWTEALPCYVEWGWNWNQSVNPTSHELLSWAQFHLGDRVELALDEQTDFAVNPMRAAINGLRPLFFYGFGDIFYYVSADGKEAIRAAVVSQIASCIERLDFGPEDPLEITLIGHSAGSVVAYDFLFYLFGPSVKSFVTHHPALQAWIERLRAAADTGALRLRRLITLGSPIAMVACRSDAVLDALHTGERLKSADYGLNHRFPASGDPRPRWVNFWDKDDPISWPAQPLMTDDGSVEDAYVDVSDLVSGAHSKYWTSKRIHRAIATAW